MDARPIDNIDNCHRAHHTTHNRIHTKADNTETMRNWDSFYCQRYADVIQKYACKVNISRPIINRLSLIPTAEETSASPNSSISEMRMYRIENSITIKLVLRVCHAARSPRTHSGRQWNLHVCHAARAGQWNLPVCHAARAPRTHSGRQWEKLSVP